MNVLLAKAWEGQDPTGWWMSEKLDGVPRFPVFVCERDYEGEAAQ